MRLPDRILLSNRGATAVDEFYPTRLMDELVADPAVRSYAKRKYAQLQATSGGGGGAGAFGGKRFKRAGKWTPKYKRGRR